MNLIERAEQAQIEIMARGDRQDLQRLFDVILGLGSLTPEVALQALERLRDRVLQRKACGTPDAPSPADSIPFLPQLLQSVAADPKEAFGSFARLQKRPRLIRLPSKIQAGSSFLIIPLFGGPAN